MSHSCQKLPIRAEVCENASICDVRATREHQFVTRIEFAWLCVYLGGGDSCTFCKKIYMYIVKHSFINAPGALFLWSRCNCRVNNFLTRSARRFEDLGYKSVERIDKGRHIHMHTYTNTHARTHARTRASTHVVCSDIEKNMASLLDRISRWKKH